MKDQENSRALFSAIIKSHASPKEWENLDKKTRERRRKEEEIKARKLSLCWKSSSVQDSQGFEG